MRRLPDLSDLVTRGFSTVVVLCLFAMVLWLVELSADAFDEADIAAGPDRAEGARATRHGAGNDEVSVEDLCRVSRRLWEGYVPAELRAELSFPSTGELRGFLERLERELQGGSAGQLAGYERQARRTLRRLRRQPGGDMLAAWLEPRLDILNAAAQLNTAPESRWPEFQPTPEAPLAAPPAMGPTPPEDDRPRAQYTRAYWDAVLARRKPPARAASLVPRLKEIFADAGVPPEWVWIAEVESSMNPEATSPVGARGLFQFMPLTAARFGLEMGVMLDERTDPEKSARAAAAYLRVLHRRFQSWPLALAAYNAGEGRVGRVLAADKAASFQEIAGRLPLETRLYVPKVLATVAARESLDPEHLPAPVAPEARRAQAGGDASAADAPASPTPTVDATTL